MSERTGLKVLFVSGYAENAVVGHGPLEPGTEAMAEPFVMDALASRIQRIIADAPTQNQAPAR